MRPLLTTTNLGMRFGGLVALNNLNLQLNSDALSGIIGPNGAGKTTVFNMLTGHYRPSGGDIFFDGKSLIGQSPAAITQRGIARTFQNIRLFKDLSVLDNIRTAAHIHTNYGLWDNLWRTRKYRRQERLITEEAMERLRTFDLADSADTIAKNLPYGQQRRLEIARALTVKPRLLLLDEPAAGMNPRETDELAQLIISVRESFHLAILLIEHDMGLVMKVCQDIHVLDHGELIAQGTPKEVQQNERVVQAYLGSPEDD